MGVYWGGEWFVVKHDKIVSLTGIIFCNKYPSATMGVDSKGNETTETIIPSIDGFEFIACKNKEEAKLEAKNQIFIATNEHLTNIGCWIAMAETKIEHLKFLIKNNLSDNSDRDTKLIELETEGLGEYAAKKRIYKMLRRRKTEEYVEPELSTLLQKANNNPNHFL